MPRPRVQPGDATITAKGGRHVCNLDVKSLAFVARGLRDLASNRSGCRKRGPRRSYKGRDPEHPGQDCRVVDLPCLSALDRVVLCAASDACAADRLALSALGQRVPHFAWLPLKERLTEVFGWVHSAWDQGKMDLARDYMTEWYARNQQLQLDKWERDGLRNITSDVRIKRMTPLCMSHGSVEPDRLVVEIEAEMRDYLVEKATDRIAQGDKALGIQTSVWSFVYENGHWLLSNIEPEDTAFEYLQEAGRALATQAQHSA